MKKANRSLVEENHSQNPKKYSEVKIPIEVHLETCQEIFQVSLHLLERYAPNFLTALKDNMAHGSLQLFNVEIETFKLFVEWLNQQPYYDDDYRGDRDDNSKPVDNNLLFVSSNLPDDYEPMDDTYMAMPVIKVYLFANEYNILVLQQDAIDRLLWSLGHSHPRSILLEAVKLVYSHTISGSPLRKILSKAFCESQFDEKKDHELLLRYPKTFLVDVMIGTTHMFDAVDEGNDSRDLCDIYDLDDCVNHGHELETNEKEPRYPCRVYPPWSKCDVYKSLRDQLACQDPH